MAFNNPIPDDDKKSRDSGGLATLVQAEKMMQFVLLLPSAAFIGWLMGYWLDKQFRMTWISAAGSVFGGIAGLVYVIRLLMKWGTDGKSRDNKNNP